MSLPQLALGVACCVLRDGWIGLTYIPLCVLLNWLLYFAIEHAKRRR